MKTKSTAFGVALLLMTLGIVGMGSARAQVQSRITSAVNNASRFTIAGSHPNAAKPANDAGAMPAGTTLQGISILLSRSATQEAALQALIQAQQTPTSPLYHQWLTPDQFAAQFGASASDIAAVESWLQAQGFSVQGVSRSQNRITFSGTVAQVNSAFATQLHYFRSGAETHFAPASDLSIPSAFASAVQTVGNLSDFRPKPRVKVQRVKPSFTSAVSGNHYLTPKDVSTIYDINAAYTAGYNGTGQSIAIAGQSFVNTADITSFQSAAGITAKTPTLVLMPNTGTPTLYAGDETESDLDLEYSSTIAKGASIFFVYTGSSPNYGVFDALVYAVDEKIAPIISISYGDCEPDLGSTYYAQYNAALEQAASQGQSVISAAGDDGSTDCAENSTDTTTVQSALAVDFPSSSQYVTGVGGTEFPAADVAASSPVTAASTYWSGASSTSTDTISSALSYIPEGVWNDDAAAYGLSSGGGGVSIFTARPSWQTGVPGIPSGNYRLVPDIALDASPDNAGYLYCTSDTSSWETGQQASCNSGFRDSATQDLTVAGGTSFAAPIFAGMLALINQARNSTGQGVANTTLYSLASNSATYASAFHDITAGSNECTSGLTYTIYITSTQTESFYCTAASVGGYAAGTGYDEASGLGSVDLNKLLTAWPTSSTSALAATTTSVSAATANPASGVADAITITVAPISTTLTTTPTGTVTVVLDGTAQTPALTLANGVATYSFSSTGAGSHIITATYSGNSVYAASTGTAALAIGSTTGSVAAGFALTSTNVTVTHGNSGTSTITATPAGGYTGTIAWTFTSNVSIPNACGAISNLPVTGTAPVSTVFTVYTSSSACASSTAVPGSGKVKLSFLKPGGLASNQAPPLHPSRTIPYGVALAGVFALGFLRRRSRSALSLFAIALVSILGLALSGCGSSSSGSTTSNANAAAGTYSITVVGTDTVNTSATATTTFTLTIN